MATCGEVLVKLLEGYGVDHVFGIPGVHTVELYRGLAGSSIRHVTPRHEQGAGLINVSRNGRLRRSNKKNTRGTFHDYCPLAVAAAPARSIVISRLTPAAISQILVLCNV